MRYEYQWDPLSVHAMNDINVCISICSCWFNRVESAHFSVFHRFLCVSWMFCIKWSLGYLLKHRLQSITPSTKHLSDERPRLIMSDCKPLTFTAFTSTNAGLFFGTCILRGPCLALEKVKLYQIKPTQSHVFFQKKITKIKSSTQLISTTLAKRW